jgi:hypothetical protein
MKQHPSKGNTEVFDSTKAVEGFATGSIQMGGQVIDENLLTRRGATHQIMWIWPASMESLVVPELSLKDNESIAGGERRKGGFGESIAGGKGGKVDSAAGLYNNGPWG